MPGAEAEAQGRTVHRTALGKNGRPATLGIGVRIVGVEEFWPRWHPATIPAILATGRQEYGWTQITHLCTARAATVMTGLTSVDDCSRLLQTS